MDLFGINIDLNSVTGPNFNIIIGVFVILIVMGVTSLYDHKKSKARSLPKTKDSKPSLSFNEKKNDFSSKFMESFSEFGNKLSNLIPKKGSKRSLESNEINHEIKPLKSSDEVPKIFGTIRSKISSFSYSLRGKKNRLESGKSLLQPNKKAEFSKLSGNEKVSGFDIDKIVESKKDELNFDDSILSEMSTASSLKKNNENIGLLNSDLEFDKNEFDIGFGALNDETPEDDTLFNTGAEKIVLADEKDSLLDSLKKDIVITSEKKINFMTAMEGQDLDIKTLESELQGVLKDIRKYKQYSNRS
jgi:hypothetical protein